MRVTMLVGLATAFATCQAGTAVGQSAAAFSLPPGRYAVGFRSHDLYDYGRSYRTPVTPTGEVERQERARPIQTSVWYPARRTVAAPMRFRDYFALGAREDGPPTPAQVARFMADMEQAWSEHLPPGEFDAIGRTPVRAVRHAKPAAGTFPVVVYNAGGGQPSWDNSVLFEYLASHGFVVIASPSKWDWERNRPLNDDYESVEAAARDIEFHIGFARTLPFVDHTRLGLMGYSWGGLASPVVALRNPSVLAVVALDGSVTWADSLLARATHRGAENMRAAFMALSSSGERYIQGAKAAGEPIDTATVRSFTELARSFPFYAGIRYADAYNATMIKFHHGNFASHFTILNGERKPGEPSMAEDQEGYAVLARYTLAFLNGYVKADSAAKAWLQRAPAANGVGDGIIRIISKAASPVPAPTIEGFAQFAKAEGFDRLRGLVDSVRKTDSTYTLSEAAAGRWVEQLDSAKRPDLGLAVRRWNVALRPESASAVVLLCPALGTRAEQTSCWTKALALDPGNHAAKAALGRETP